MTVSLKYVGCHLRGSGRPAHGPPLPSARLQAGSLPYSGAAVQLPRASGYVELCPQQHGGSEGQGPGLRQSRHAVARSLRALRPGGEEVTSPLSCGPQFRESGGSPLERRSKRTPCSHPDRRAGKFACRPGNLSTPSIHLIRENSSQFKRP